MYVHVRVSELILLSKCFKSYTPSLLFNFFLHCGGLFCIFYFFPISHSFPMISHFWPKTMCVTIFFFFYNHLAFSNHALNFLCVCSPTKCHKSHQVSYHSGEAPIFENSKCKILQSKVTEDRTRDLSENILWYFHALIESKTYIQHL